MYAYIVRRLLLIVPTLLGIMVINFAVVQVLPGGPVEQWIAQLTGEAVDVTARVGGEAGSEVNAGKRTQVTGKQAGAPSRYRGAQGLPPDLIKDIERQFGLDKPAFERFTLMIGNYLRFDFGDSFFQDKSVAQLVIDKLPVSISLGLWTTLLVYMISIPLGIRKAVKDGSRFDVWTSGVVIFGNAVPSFLFAILLIMLFARGGLFPFFPLRGLTSPDFETLSWFGQIADYFWHMALPLLSMVIGGFAGLTMLTKNSFLEEINKQYVITARAKGLGEWAVVIRHVFKNALIPIITLVGPLVPNLMTGSIFIESTFAIPGLGRHFVSSIFDRDYPVILGMFMLVAVLFGLTYVVSDILYTWADPRVRLTRRN